MAMAQRSLQSLDFSQLRRVDGLPSGLKTPSASGNGVVSLLPGSQQKQVRVKGKARVNNGFAVRASGGVVELEPASPGSPILVPRLQYADSVSKTVRRKTRTVMVGNVAVGSDHPIRVQTMTTSDTKNVQATVEEVMRIADRGAEICRITVQGRKEAEACEQIKNKLVQANYNIPLVADIHFAPTIALRVADCFDKIRINPGNYADTRAVFKTVEYTDESYQQELEHIDEVFSKLVLKCKQLGRAMRIGTNHGSLSDRIMSYYGDSPRGMVESALEFARICRKHDYHNFVFSMKASNPVVMVAAYRLLAAQLRSAGPDWNYPLHLGVTEAGEGEDGRMKSAIGIGALLQDGLGDTIRVSLTEAPEEEIEPCSALANYGMRAAKLGKGVEDFEEKHRSYFEFSRRSGQLPLQKEGDAIDFRGMLHRDGSVLMSVDAAMLKNPEALYRALACKMAVGMPFKDLATVDSILLRQAPAADDKEARLALRRLQEVGVGVLVPVEALAAAPLPNAVALLSLEQAKLGVHKHLPQGAARFAVSVRGDESEEDLKALVGLDAVMLLAHVPPQAEDSTVSRVHSSRRLFEFLQSNNIMTPVIHHISFPEGTSKDDLVLQSGAEAGALLVDGLGDGVLLEAPSHDMEFLRNTSFGMLQGCRMRNTKTEFVSCPSCGRTLFDLQEVTASIRERTSHLPGVAIAIMGCIVNGPGEMADADFGYVGGAPGKIDLYVGKRDFGYVGRAPGKIDLYVSKVRALCWAGWHGGLHLGGILAGMVVGMVVGMVGGKFVLCTHPQCRIMPSVPIDAAEFHPSHSQLSPPPSFLLPHIPPHSIPPQTTPSHPNPSNPQQEVVQRGIPMEEATDALVKLIKDHGRWVEPMPPHLTPFHRTPLPSTAPHPPQQEVVQRGIPMEEATDALVTLIKDHGRWVEPAQEEEAQAVAA
ncbi:unnamed protein product [Closterium sp. Naga37s-1]|nr:unnamed protein product [Closterium sp. Naga37s-1]